ncbi:hypothetical protein [Methylobacterium sp. Leaf85]|uniref:hypothetical protein n=1 Tax=Methylobacterium sp. Leaf85 TaxID=1736241 RepID=UPI000A6C5419|nr:hypothetical protein [Methylobacterium sp. Leaf85]
MSKRTKPGIFTPPEPPPTPEQWAAEMAPAATAAAKPYTVERVEGGCDVIRLSRSCRKSRSGPDA